MGKLISRYWFLTAARLLLCPRACWSALLHLFPVHLPITSAHLALNFSLSASALLLSLTSSPRLAINSASSSSVFIYFFFSPLLFFTLSLPEAKQAPTMIYHYVTIDSVNCIYCTGYRLLLKKSDVGQAGCVVRLLMNMTRFNYAFIVAARQCCRCFNGQF